MAEPTNIPRPLSPPAEENTPLLTGGGESSTQQEGAGQTTPLALSDAENAEASITTARIFFFIKLTTCVSLSTSIICLVVLLAAYITCELSPSGYYGWGFEELILQLGTFVWAVLSYRFSFSLAAKAGRFTIDLTLNHS